MFHSFFAHKVEIKKVKYRTGSGTVYPQTAIVTFMDERKETLGIELFGHIPPDEIFRIIQEGGDLNLDQCYVIDFSLPVYREIRKLDKKFPVPLKNFSARKAMFFSNQSTNFYHASFQGKETVFEGAVFDGGKTVFNSSRFEGQVNFGSTCFRNGNLDFANAVFREGNVSFNNAVIMDGVKDFQYVDFGLGDVSFANTEFNGGELSFINAQFNTGNVSFKVARIREGKVDFHFAKFGNGDISFERTEFGNSRVDFRTVEFNDGRVNFNRSVFGNGDVSFEGCELKNGKFSFKRAILGDGEFNFELAEFGGVDVIFDRTSFGNGPVSFRQSKFGLLSLHSCHLDHYFDLRVRNCRHLDLGDTIVRDIIDMKPYDFPVEIEELDLSGMRLQGTIHIDWKANRLKMLIGRQENTNRAEKAEQFRVLKENFNKLGQYSDEDSSYVEFKRNEARAKMESSLRRNRLNAVWLFPWHAFKWLVLDLAGLYATAPHRVLVSMLGWYVLFSFVYLALFHLGVSEIHSSTGHTLPALARAFYHSAITFLTIGYGDHFPVGASRIVSAIEGFAGMFLMAYFTVSLVRKILR